MNEIFKFLFELLGIVFISAAYPILLFSNAIFQAQIILTFGVIFYAFSKLSKEKNKQGQPKIVDEAALLIKDGEERGMSTTAQTFGRILRANGLKIDEDVYNKSGEMI